MNIEYNIYCDESCYLEHDNIKPMILGAVWCPKSDKDIAFQRLRELKTNHGLHPTCELKWNAVSPSKLDYYKDVVNYFFDNSNIHFRALVVPDKSELNHEAHGQSHDEFYYKMYFSLLKAILDPQCTYDIYLDIKDTLGQERIQKLQDVICNNAYDFNHHILKKIQLVRSHEVELIQLADFLAGAIGYAHRSLQTSKAKLEIIELIKKRSGKSLLRSTLYKEDKMNIFVWKGQKHE